MLERQWAGRYRLEEVLGRGSMGVVWRARDEVLGREVAVKVLPSDVDAQESIPAARLLQEAHALAQVDHPNVVRILDISRSEGRPFYVMEMLVGRTLSAILREPAHLAESDIRSIWAQLLEAVRAVHRAGVVHRDLKPSNVIRLSDGTVKLTDFGLAYDGWSDRLTHSGTFVGTVAYAAPERIRGNAVDARSDLYSLGCVLYEMLCGRPPFLGDAAAQTYGHVHRTPSPPSAFRSGVPEDLERIAMSLLAKDPGRRPDLGALDTPTVQRPLHNVGRVRWRVPALAGSASTLALLLVAWAPGGLGEPRPVVAPKSTPRPSAPSVGSAVAFLRTAKSAVTTPVEKRRAVRESFGVSSGESISVTKAKARSKPVKQPATKPGRGKKR